MRRAFNYRGSRTFTNKGVSIIKHMYHYITYSRYYGEQCCADWYELYEATNSTGVTKTFGRASKAWAWARK